MASTSYSTTSDLYSGVLGRTASQEELDYRNTQFGDTIDESEITAFQTAAQPELTQNVSTNYQELFGRDADTAGQEYWTNQINSGLISTASDLSTASGGASAEDQSANADNASYSTAWDSSLDPSEESVTYDATQNKWVDATVQVPTFSSSAPATPAANTIREITPEETVSGQLNTLLAEDSVYLQSARNYALEEANQRGLLNSSIAVGAGERAAIDAAAPIAAQDASTYAASGLSAQNANQQLTQTGYEGAINLYNSSALSAQEAGQALTQTGYESSLESGLSAQAAEQEYELQTTLKQMDIDMDLTTLAQSDREAFTAAITPIMQQVQAEISNIERTADSVMDSEAKLTAIAEQQAFLKSSIAPIAAIYGYEITWSDSELLTEREQSVEQEQAATAEAAAAASTTEAQVKAGRYQKVPESGQWLDMETGAYLDRDEMSEELKEAIKSVYGLLFL